MSHLGCIAASTGLHSSLLSLRLLKGNSLLLQVRQGQLVSVGADNDALVTVRRRPLPRMVLAQLPPCLLMLALQPGLHTVISFRCMSVYRHTYKRSLQ